MNKGRPGGRLGEAKGGSRRARSAMLRVTPRAAKGEGMGRRRSAGVKPAGRGGKAQRAGGPEHRGLDASEDRNP